MLNQQRIYFSNNSRSDIAIVLLQMGGPYNLDLVEPFLYNLFKDEDIIQLPRLLRPFQKLIAKMIVRKRGHKVKRNYKLIGGESPILEHTSSLAKNIYEILNKKEVDTVDITLIMRYSEPRADKIIELLKTRRINRIILFPLYPHFSNSTSGSSFKDFNKYAKLNNYSPEIIEIKDWGLQPFYLDWWISQLSEILLNDKENTEILFTAHGLPQRYIDNGDPYLETLKPCIAQIMSNFPNYHYKLSFQSNVGPVEWLRPYTTDSIKEFTNEPRHKLIFVPIGFVSDHIETLQEIDLLYTDQAKKVGFKNIQRIKVPNSSVKFAEGIVDFLSLHLR